MEHTDTEIIDAIARSVIVESQRRDLSIARVADISGVDRSVVSRWLGGKRNISASTAAKILDALGLRIVPSVPAADRNGGPHKP